MEYLVVVRLRDQEGKLIAEWPEVAVKAVEKWDALVKVTEGLGVASRVTMSELWKWSSIKQAHRKPISRRRVE